jgi:uncharacterized membrane protein
VSLHPDTLVAILGMALVTYLCRIGGVLLSGRLHLSGRAAAAFEAIPTAVLTAVIAPTVLVTGPAETLAGLVTVAAALRLSLIGTVAVGVVAVLLARSAGL